MSDRTSVDDVFQRSPRDVVASTLLRSRQHPLTANERWLLAVSLGAIGRYRDALNTLGWPAMPGPREDYPSQWISTAASFHRQVGRHREARDLDERALICANDDLDRCDALVGLAADSVGLADVVAANEHWAMATTFAGADWRRLARSAWVRAEIDLLMGDPGSAINSARRACGLSEQAGAPRHRAKSELVLGVALMTARQPEARHHLETALNAARSLGVWTLVWPAALVLAGLEPLGAADLRREARVVTATLEFCLPEHWRRNWREAHGYAE